MPKSDEHKLEYQLLARHLETLAGSIEEHVMNGILGRMSSREHNAHGRFLDALQRLLRRKISSSDDFTKLKRDLEKAASEYLIFLRKLTDTSTDQLHKKGPAHKKGKAHPLSEEDLAKLKAIQHGIGVALLRIERISAAAPQFESTGWLVRFAKNLRQSLLGFLHGKRHLKVSSVMHEAKKAARSHEASEAISTLRSANDARRVVALQKQGEDNLYVKAFNQSPEKTVALLPASAQSPEGIASFLITNARWLNESQVADYLGGEKNEAVLNAYIAERYTFTGQSLIDAIRHFLGTCQLPVEGQKVTRFMEGFAARYYEGNPHTFADRDAVNMLAVAMVMLNTDLHNPKIPARNKMTEEQFIRNLRGTNGGADFPRELLSEIYRDLRDHEMTRFDEARRPKVAPTKS
jgi:hypothetical protein